MVSLEQFIWKDLQKTVSMTKLLKCEARVRQEAVEPFYIKVTNETRLFMYTLRKFLYFISIFQNFTLCSTCNTIIHDVSIMFDSHIMKQYV